MYLSKKLVELQMSKLEFNYFMPGITALVVLVEITVLQFTFQK